MQELDHAEMHSAPTSERPYVFSTEQQTDTSQHGNRLWWPKVCWWRKSCRQQLAIEGLGAEKAATPYTAHSTRHQMVFCSKKSGMRQNARQTLRAQTTQMHSESISGQRGSSWWSWQSACEKRRLLPVGVLLLRSRHRKANRQTSCAHRGNTEAQQVGQQPTRLKLVL